MLLCLQVSTVPVREHVQVIIELLGVFLRPPRDRSCLIIIMWDSGWTSTCPLSLSPFVCHREQTERACNRPTREREADSTSSNVSFTPLLHHSPLSLSLSFPTAARLFDGFQKFKGTSQKASALERGRYAEVSYTLLTNIPDILSFFKVAWNTTFDTGWENHATSDGKIGCCCQNKRILKAKDHESCLNTLLMHRLATEMGRNSKQPPNERTAV